MRVHRREEVKRGASNHQCHRVYCQQQNSRVKGRHVCFLPSLLPISSICPLLSSSGPPALRNYTTHSGQCLPTSMNLIKMIPLTFSQTSPLWFFLNNNNNKIPSLRCFLGSSRLFQPIKLSINGVLLSLTG